MPMYCLQIPHGLHQCVALGLLVHIMTVTVFIKVPHGWVNQLTSPSQIKLLPALKLILGEAIFKYSGQVRSKQRRY